MTLTSQIRQASRTAQDRVEGWWMMDAPFEVDTASLENLSSRELKNSIEFLDGLIEDFEFNIQHGDTWQTPMVHAAIDLLHDLGEMVKERTNRTLKPASKPAQMSLF